MPCQPHDGSNLSNASVRFRSKREYPSVYGIPTGTPKCGLFLNADFDLA